VLPVLQRSWRKPHGIDNRARRRYKGNLLLPSVGYGTNVKTKHVLPNGFKKVVISNAAELEVLLMHNKKYCGEIASAVSKATRAKLVERAQQLGVRLTNGKAGLAKVETA
jgi:large subunit ribosomal protein L32e